MTTTKKRWQERGWQTYGEAHAYFRGIIREALALGYEPGRPLPSLYETTLRWLLAGDPTFPKEDWSNIGYFTLHRPYSFDRSKVGFAVARVRLLSDGIDPLHHFSVRACLGQVPRKSRVSTVFKTEIADQLEAAQKQFSVNSRCPETGELLMAATTMLDYQGPGFDQLLQTFLQKEGLQMRQVELDDEGLADRALATRWWAYHAANAKLIGVSKRGLKIRNDRRKADPFWGLST
jgi:hypothetical protein